MQAGGAGGEGMEAPDLVNRQTVLVKDHLHPPFPSHSYLDHRQPLLVLRFLLGMLLQDYHLVAAWGEGGGRAVNTCWTKDWMEYSTAWFCGMPLH